MKSKYFKKKTLGKSTFDTKTVSKSQIFNLIHFRLK